MTVTDIESKQLGQVIELKQAVAARDAQIDSQRQRIVELGAYAHEVKALREDVARTRETVTAVTRRYEQAEREIAAARSEAAALKAQADVDAATVAHARKFADAIAHFNK